MTDYIPITEPETDPGAPSRSSLWKRWSKNCLAMFEGAAGAPRLQGKAIARAGLGLPVVTVSASDAYTLGHGAGRVDGAPVTASIVDVVAHTFTLLAFAGVVRVKASHAAGGGYNSTLSLYKNNVLVTSWVATTIAARVYDMAIAGGDVLELRHRVSSNNNSSTVSAVSITASDAYVEQPVYILKSDA